MPKKQEVLDDLLKKIDECDDLIVEISQIRYWLDDVVKQLKHKKGSGTPVRTGVRSK
jgi:chorismate mutase